MEGGGSLRHLIRRIREAAGRSPRAFSLTALFAVALLSLLVALWVQVRRATEVLDA